MASHLSKSDVEYVARLARLELTPEEQDLFSRQLTAILGYAEQIGTIDTNDVRATSHVLSDQAANRDDTAQPSLDRREALAQAPDAAIEAGFFRVPRVLQ